MLAFAAGLLAGFSAPLGWTIAAAGAGLGGAAFRRDSRFAALALLFASGGLTATLSLQRDAACIDRARAASVWSVRLREDVGAERVVRGDLARTSCSIPMTLVVAAGHGRAGDVVSVRGEAFPSRRGLFVRDATIRYDAAPTAAASDLATEALVRVRADAGRRVTRLFGNDAAIARALLVADATGIPPDMRDRYADAGLVHMLSISGLHVAIIAAAMQLLFQLLRLGPRAALLGALIATIAYVAVIGAPAPALRSGVMLAVTAVSRLVQRPTSPWSALALGAWVPLADPRVILDLGYQLSVAGMAALVASGILARRLLPERIDGWRRSLLRDFIASIVASAVTAPLVAWAFGRVSLVAPLSNLVAGPLLVLAQPMLFLALLLSPLEPVARFVADASHPLLWAFDRIAIAGAAVPFGALAVSPTLVTAMACGIASGALLMVCVARHPGRAMATGVAALAVALWIPLLPTTRGELEIHMLDVGQGDAFALRTVRGRWVLVDAGRSWRGADAGRRTIVPYVRRRGGDVAAFILSHPHADHAGGAATVARTLSPRVYWDAAFAGGSESYAQSLAAARDRGIEWRRVHPGDSVVVDATVIRFLAPDSAWTSSLADPNEASTVALVRHGRVRFLFVGDAERAEERWLLEHAREQLRADVLKVGHHGSATSTSAAFLDAVRPGIALVSVGAGNSYGHPSDAVVGALRASGADVLRTDLLGTVVLRTDGRRLTISAHGETWPSSRPLAGP